LGWHEFMGEHLYMYQYYTCAIIDHCNAGQKKVCFLLLIAAALILNVHEWTLTLWEIMIY